MYAKVFAQIFDSSIADDYKLRHFFMDLLVLADSDGVIDMTPTAIASRTRIPLREVNHYLEKLESPDKRSRTPDDDGRRIKQTHPERGWGWVVINYDNYRRIADEEERKRKTRDRVSKYRETLRNKKDGNAAVTPSNACNCNTEGEGEGEGAAKAAVFSASKSMAEIQKVFDEWNRLGVVPKCLVISDKRRRLLGIRLRDTFFSKNWLTALSKIKQSRFCQGEGPRGWTATFDWFIQPDTCLKIIEGKYDNQSAATATQQRLPIRNAI